MKFTYNWLKEYVNISIPTDELSDILTMGGLEVETLTYLGDGLQNIDTVRITAIKPHPNADKLSLCEVTDGSESREIVCGAKNMKVADIVALAKQGAVLPNGLKIKPTKIRGISSDGMLCSEKELGLADESSGIMILPEGTKVGEPIASALGLDDYLFEIGLTPNRSDCLSLHGIANEVSVLTGAELKPFEFNLTESENSIEGAIDVAIENSDACNRYTARVLKNVVIKESDPIIKARLNAIGIRSINNIVDITNYVMFVYGQPLHAFDYNLISGKKIIVKCATEGEKFMTLDEKERALKSSDLMICDSERSVALGGVMGGVNSEVSDNTTDVLLESAYFNPTNIRRTARRLGLASDSSHRFERGVNPDTVTEALDYAASLMQRSTGCEILKGIADVHPVEYVDRTVSARVSRVNKVLGTDFTMDGFIEQLKRLKLEIVSSDDDSAVIKVPRNRHDLVKEIDIIEDIARIYGYDNIKVTLPKVPAVAKKKKPRVILTDKVRNTLSNNGFFEVINYSFYAPKDVELFSMDKSAGSIKVLNPLTDEQSVMRLSLLPGLLDTAKRNINHKNTDLKLFELGKTFFKKADDSIVETVELAGIITGNRCDETWGSEKKVVDFYDIKGIIELILENIKVIGYIVKEGSSRKYLHPTVSAEIYMGKDLLGVIGELHPDINENYSIDGKVYLFEFAFEKLCKYAKKAVTFKQLPKYPYVQRDIALVVDKDIASADIVKEISSRPKNLVEDVAIFDLYEGKQVGEGKKSIAFRITYRDKDRTLTDDAVSEIMSNLSTRLEKKFGGQLRK